MALAVRAAAVLHDASTGIAAVIVTGDGIYRGAIPYAGELGHITIRPDGRTACAARGGC